MLRSHRIDATWISHILTCSVLFGCLLCSSFVYGAPEDWCAPINSELKPNYAASFEFEVPVTTPAGTPVYAMDDGVVKAVYDGTKGNMPEQWALCGADVENAKEVVVVHDGLEVHYGMLLKIADGIEPGRPIVRGTVIGMVGRKVLCVPESVSDAGSDTGLLILKANNVNLSGLSQLSDCPCVPNCINRECGNDGCGGSCGSCYGNSFCQSGSCVCMKSDVKGYCGGDGCGQPLILGQGYLCENSEQSCQNNQCVIVKDCKPRCRDFYTQNQVRYCGNDGCGGSCGDCPANSVCENYECICVPQCDGRACGDDGCGGSCGTCKSGVCDEFGQCLCEDNGEVKRTDCVNKSDEEQPCGAICYGSSSGSGSTGIPGVDCVIECSDRFCGEDNGCGGICGFCSNQKSCQETNGKYSCVEPENEECEPSCDDKQCGSNGCGGICGECGDDFSCLDGKCKFGALPKIELIESVGCSLSGHRPISGGELFAVLFAMLGGFAIRRQTVRNVK